MKQRCDAPHLTPALSSPEGRRGRQVWRRLRSLSALPGRQARTARLRRAPNGAERRASTRAERTIERSERPAIEGNE